jgi:RNA polymerase sigma factor (TIGR02999 family)
MKSDGQPGEVTQILARWRGGDQKALDELMPLVYREMRELASRSLRRERPHHTLQSTALVHEAYLRLVHYDRIDWRSRAHFLAVAATLIRQILVDHARSRMRAKRGGGNLFLQLEDSVPGAPQREVNLVALDDALMDLSRLDKQQAKVVELRLFGGLSIEETAEVLSISDSTVKRDWAVAKSWLFRELGPGAVQSSPTGP